MFNCFLKTTYGCAQRKLSQRIQTTPSAVVALRNKGTVGDTKEGAG